MGKVFKIAFKDFFFCVYCSSKWQENKANNKKIVPQKKKKLL